MRLWSIHPKYLDRLGLVALWREGLLAQKVLMGQTKGFTRHPQLERFLSLPDPVGAIGDYLSVVWDESVKRGYRFDRGKIFKAARIDNIPVNRGQLEYEIKILRQRLRSRDISSYRRLIGIDGIECHPAFRVVEGGIEEWERG